MLPVPPLCSCSHWQGRSEPGPSFRHQTSESTHTSMPNQMLTISKVVLLLIHVNYQLSNQKGCPYQIDLVREF